MPALSQHACFVCRKVFKRPHEYRRFGRQGDPPGRTIHKCPECGGQMIYMGYKFRAPAARDRESWRRIERALLPGQEYGITTVAKQKPE